MIKMRSSRQSWLES